MLQKAAFPGSDKIAAGHAIRSLLVLKLFGSARHSHVMSYVFDEGLAVFSGLNTIPKRSFLTEYSCRIDPGCYPRFMHLWFDAMGTLGLRRGVSFDLDFHTIPFHGEDALMEKHYISNRRRSREMLAQISTEPLSAWRRIELDVVTRLYKTPRIIDRRIVLPRYHGPLRQIIITDLGHEEPTLLLTNQLRRSPAKLIARYAQRMIIENNIADGIDFFHMDALSSAVAMKVNCDLQLTLMASSLYRLLGARIGNGYERAKSSHTFRDFVIATASLSIDERQILVRFQKRAHNPLLLAADFAKTEVAIPWLARKKL